MQIPYVSCHTSASDVNSPQSILQATPYWHTYIFALPFLSLPSPSGGISLFPGICGCFLPFTDIANAALSLIKTLTKKRTAAPPRWRACVCDMGGRLPHSSRSAGAWEETLTRSYNAWYQKSGGGKTPGKENDRVPGGPGVAGARRRCQALPTGLTGRARPRGAGREPSGAVHAGTGALTPQPPKMVAGRRLATPPPPPPRLPLLQPPPPPRTCAVARRAAPLPPSLLAAGAPLTDRGAERCWAARASGTPPLPLPRTPFLRVPPRRTGEWERRAAPAPQSRAKRRLG